MKKILISLSLAVLGMIAWLCQRSVAAVDSSQSNMLIAGLGALHRCSLVHRDINANNILITTDGNVKIIDYGIVRLFDKSKSTDTVILGTPGYAAPEQFGFTQSDSRTDIYALGVLMNVMMTGRLPSEDTARGGISRIIEKCVMIILKTDMRILKN